MVHPFFNDVTLKIKNFKFIFNKVLTKYVKCGIIYLLKEIKSTGILAAIIHTVGGKHIQIIFL